jgi:hypothetical protein
VTTIAAGRAQGLVGDLRIGGSVLRGTRTEWLPFPCHPGDRAFLADLDPALPIQYWEQMCTATGCGMTYRFEHSGRLIRWYPIVSLTAAGTAPALPLDRIGVEARLRRERGANPFPAPVLVPSGTNAPDLGRAPGLIRRLTSAHH